MIIFVFGGHLGFHIARYFYFRPSKYVIIMKKSISQLENMFSFTNMVKFGSFEPCTYSFSKIENQKKNLSTPFTPHPYQLTINFFANLLDKIFPSNIQKEFCNYLKRFVFHVKKSAQASNNFCPFLGVSCPFSLEVPAGRYQRAML